MNRQDQTIYLSGGMHTTWRKSVKESLSPCTGCRFQFFDPMAKDTDRKLRPAEYASWNLHHIEQADVFLGFMEKSNPAGHGLCLEAAWAKAHGKTVVLVIEPGNLHQKDARFDYVKQLADVVYETLDEATEYLKLYR